MTWQTSSSDPSGSLFDQLADPVKKWIWKQGWADLHDIQERAIAPLLAGGDAIISAATAGGKTEAAFFPLLSKVLRADGGSGFDLLYVSPLKALINDQFYRLESLCGELEIPVTKWHGDVGAGVKSRAVQNPEGVLLITPESLESLLMRRGLQIPRLFGATQCIIIDELHAFMGTERGVQLISLLNRLEVLTDHEIHRVGLSATLGDMSMAAQYLREGRGLSVPIISGDSGDSNLKLQLRAYIDQDQVRGDGSEGDLPSGAADVEIARHIFNAVRGKHNLVFAGSKQKVELYGATLRDLCETDGLPNEFFTHHANISKSDREFLESRLKIGRLPTTAVCTSTLELGIDIGDVETIVQVGCGGSVSALRQRIGRSGRRPGAPSILRAYSRLNELTGRSHIVDRLRLRLVQAIAEIELLLEGQFEPPSPGQVHLSTLVHQILALIVERGGLDAREIHRTLLRPGPFGNVSTGLLTDVLRSMARQKTELIEQAPDGTILLGREGELLTSHYQFYAVFETEEEFRVIASGRDLGTLPVLGPTAKNMIIIFSGRRWQITEVRLDEKVIVVIPAKGGSPPEFGGNGPSRHSIVDQAMISIYRSNSTMRYLDPVAAKVLDEARDFHRHCSFDQRGLLDQGDEVFLFPWAGSAMISGLALVFQHEGVKVENLDYALSIKDTSLSRARAVIERLAEGNIPDTEEMAWSIENKTVGQYDHYLTDTLLVKQLASTLPGPEDFQQWASNLLSDA